jgi:hypothetical protein
MGTINISIHNCAFCNAEAEHQIVETETPICNHCMMMYEMGKENQGTIEEI